MLSIPSSRSNAPPDVTGTGGHGGVVHATTAGARGSPATGARHGRPTRPNPYGAVIDPPLSTVASTPNANWRCRQSSAMAAAHAAIATAGSAISALSDRCAPMVAPGRTLQPSRSSAASITGTPAADSRRARTFSMSSQSGVQVSVPSASNVGSGSAITTDAPGSATPPGPRARPSNSSTASPSPATRTARPVVACHDTSTPALTNSSRASPRSSPTVASSAGCSRNEADPCEARSTLPVARFASSNTMRSAAATSRSASTGVDASAASATTR